MSKARASSQQMARPRSALFFEQTLEGGACPPVGRRGRCSSRVTPLDRHRASPARWRRSPANGGRGRSWPRPSGWPPTPRMAVLFEPCPTLRRPSSTSTFAPASESSAAGTPTLPVRRVMPVRRCRPQRGRQAFTTLSALGINDETIDDAARSSSTTFSYDRDRERQPETLRGEPDPARRTAPVPVRLLLGRLRGRCSPRLRFVWQRSAKRRLAYAAVSLPPAVSLRRDPRSRRYGHSVHGLRSGFA